MVGYARLLDYIVSSMNGVTVPILALLYTHINTYSNTYVTYSNTCM